MSEQPALVRPAQRLEPQVGRAGRAQRVHEGGRRRGGGRGTGGEPDQQREPVGPLEPAERQHGGLVGPVQVVEQQGHAPPGTEVLDAVAQFTGVIANIHDRVTGQIKAALIVDVPGELVSLPEVGQAL